MRPGEQLRNMGFWSLDFLLGRKVKAHLDDIKLCQESYYNKEAIKRQELYLNNILKHATETTSFYSPYTNFKSLFDFPVVDKLTIKAHFDDFRSSKYLNKKIFKSVTSGSTGTPFVIFLDQNKKQRNTADTIYFSGLAGFEIGHRLYYIRIWNELNQKHTFTKWAQNIIEYNAFNQSKEDINTFIQQINRDKSNIGILGYASVIESIVDFMIQNNLKIFSPVKSIITMSETLSKTAQKDAVRFLNVRPVSRYSNMENGIIAQQCHHECGEFHINRASYFVEVLKLNSDEHVAVGEPGRIVITDYFNYAMPFIRYDTGDIGVLADEPKCGYATPVFRIIEGRKMDQIYNTKGELVSSFIVTNSLWKYTELDQYQFIQKGPQSYLFKLNVHKQFNREKELIDEFKGYLGAKARIAVEYVDEIPVLSSGKRKKVVNCMDVTSQ